MNESKPREDIQLSFTDAQLVACLRDCAKEYDAKGMWIAAASLRAAADRLVAMNSERQDELELAKEAGFRQGMEFARSHPQADAPSACSLGTDTSQLERTGDNDAAEG